MAKKHVWLAAVICLLAFALPLTAQTDGPPVEQIPSTGLIVVPPDEASILAANLETFGLIPPRLIFVGAVTFEGYGVYGLPSDFPFVDDCAALLPYRMSASGILDLWSGESYCQEGQLYLQGEGRGHFFFFRAAGANPPPERIPIVVET